MWVVQMFAYLTYDVGLFFPLLVYIIHWGEEKAMDIMLQ